MATQLIMALRILRLKQLTQLIQLSRSSVYARLSPGNSLYDDSFPKPIKLGASAVGWIEAEIVTWLEGRIAASRPLAKQGGAR